MGAQNVFKMQKCKFALDSVEYLGYIICDGKVWPDPEKNGSCNYMAYAHVCQIYLIVIGFPSHYNRFICNFEIIAAPITDLLHNHCTFDRGP